MQNTVKVVVRCRPLDKDEKKKGSKAVLQCDYNRKEVSIQNDNDKLAASYYYDKVFNSTASQEFVYRSVVADVVEDTLKGFNCTVFAYGQTGTGKTYTMEGYRTATKANSPFWYGPDAGMIPRAAQQIFQHMEACKKNFSVFVTCLELYNEEVIDLLIPEGQTSKPLHIRDESSGKGVVVSGLQEVQVRSPEEIFKLLEGTSHKRHTAETLSNDRSSRSHCIFTITVHSKEAADNGEDLLRTGKLNLVDLAGSENTKRSGATGIVMKQAVMINKSLLTLRRVITALSSGKNTHIPFRDSKLTRLLQESLGGQAKTCMIATIAPSTECLEETRSTLQYALSAKNIKNTPVVYQKLTKKAKIKEFEEQISSLRDQLAASCAADGYYVDHKTWQEHLMNVEHYKELSTNIENKDIHISQLQQQSTSRDEELVQRKAEIQQLEEDLQQMHQELALVKEEYQQSGGKIDDQCAILYVQKQTEVQLQEQTQLLQSQALVVVEDLRNIHKAIERHQNQLNGFKEHTIQAQKVLCKHILQTIQNLSAFQQSHQSHASKLGSSWKKFTQCHKPFMTAINEEKQSLYEFVSGQLSVLDSLLQQDLVHDIWNTDDEIQSKLHQQFSDSMMKEQNVLFDNVLHSLDRMDIQFQQFLDFVLSSMKEYKSLQMEHVNSYQASATTQQQIHHQHHKTLQKFSVSQRNIVDEQQNVIQTICSAVNEAIAKSHANIVQDVQQLLSESAEEQARIMKESLEEVSTSIAKNIPHLEVFEAQQGTLILSALGNLKVQKSSVGKSAALLLEKSSSIVEETCQNHKEISESTKSLYQHSSCLKEDARTRWDTYQQWKKVHHEELTEKFSTERQNLEESLSGITNSVDSFFNDSLQQPINTWNDFVNNNTFLNTVSNVYSRNEELLTNQDETLKEIDDLVNGLAEEMKSSVAEGNTPKKEKAYDLPIPSADTPPIVKRKVRRGSAKRIRNSSSGRLPLNAQPINIDKGNEPTKESILEKRKRSVAQRTTQRNSTRTQTQLDKIQSTAEPTRKRRRVAQTKA